eukprot:GILI01003367.1.p1 GENE.GILI01003367.1~~GILI01003367.1.p1  ORF type:complete len:457 (-),score=77.79 GILI01003367.1:485-1756(-)
MNGRYSHRPYTPAGQTAQSMNGQIVTPSPQPSHLQQHYHQAHSTPCRPNTTHKGLATPKLAGVTDTDIQSELMSFAGGAGGGGPIYEPQRDSPSDWQRQMSSSPWRGVFLSSPQGTPQHNHKAANQQYTKSQQGRPQGPKPMLYLGGEATVPYHPVPRPANSYFYDSNAHESPSAFHKPPKPSNPVYNPYPKVRSHPELDSASNFGPIRVTPVNNKKSNRNTRQSKSPSPLNEVASWPSSAMQSGEYIARHSGGSFSTRAGPPAPLGENLSMDAVWPYQNRLTLPREGSSDGMVLIGTPTADFSATFVTANSPTDPNDPNYNSQSYEEQIKREKRVVQRQKQVNIGKATVGYQTYINSVPIAGRVVGNPHHPATPVTDGLCAKRAFDRLVREWRKALHGWDPEPELESLTGSLHVGHGSDDDE